MRWAWGWSMLVVVSAGCRSPTQITLEVTTDVPCDTEVLNTGVAVGSRETVELGFNGTTTACVLGADGEARIGSIVAVPSGDRDAEVSFKVVSQLGVSGDPSCEEDDAAQSLDPDCIVARRVLRFIDHTPLVLPVRMSEACLGRYCEPGTTCVDGGCVDATIAACALMGDERVCTPPEPPPRTATPGWTLLVTGAESVVIADVAMDAGGNVYVAGNFRGAPMLAGTITLEASASEERAFLASFDRNGNLRWVQTEAFSSSAGSRALSLELSNDGRVWVSGAFVGSMLTLYAPNDWDGLVLTFDAKTGAFREIAIPIAGDGDQLPVAFDVDGDRVWAAVEFGLEPVWPYASFDYVPNGETAADDVLVAGIEGVGTSSAMALPGLVLGGSGTTSAAALGRIDGSIYVAGQYQGNLSRAMLDAPDPQVLPTTPTGARFGYFARLEAATGHGAELWPIVADDVTVSGLATHGSEVCMGGDFAGVLRVGAVNKMLWPSDGSYDLWVACVDATGTPTRAIRFGDGRLQRAHHLTDGVAGDVLVSGGFVGTLQLGTASHDHPEPNAPPTPFIASLRRSDLAPRWSRGFDGAHGFVIDAAAAGSVDGRELVLVAGHHDGDDAQGGSVDLEGTAVPLGDTVAFITMLIDP